MTVYLANGMTIARGDGASPEVFTAIAQVQTIGQGGVDRQLIDVTNLSSTLREYKKAIPDGVELQIVAQYDPDDTGHTALKTDADAADARNFRMTFPDSPAQVWDFPAQVTNWTVGNIEIDGVLQLNVTLKPTGSLVIT